MSEDWTHPICRICWDYRTKYKRKPVTLDPPETETCCFCGATTRSGIYVRMDPNEMTCKGIHTKYPPPEGQST